MQMSPMIFFYLGLADDSMGFGRYQFIWNRDGTCRGCISWNSKRYYTTHGKSWVQSERQNWT